MQPAGFAGATIVNSRTGAGRPTKAQAAAKTEALLDIARALFCERGYAGASIDEIADTLKWSKHTVYNRFPNKLALLEAVVDRDVERFKRSMRDAGGASGDPIDALQSIARAYFGFSSSPSYSALYSAVALEAATSSHLRQKLMEWATTSLEPLRRAIEAATPRSGWNARTVEEACEILIDLLDGEANRLKWSGNFASAAAVEHAFARRWQVFALAVVPQGRW
ncbi:TetR/AcrR family transcriptional regulator [Bosea sp. F3-2]|uniref:TetR/AcrR family transcriptional regulator n=1 Tax=Bosea sp. F3-2 TaxID=2599640 RepID=UPI0011EF13F3|nr:TetR/AcrR family transcriptional regulator [Bosea sp. F3-2]QEL23754.1 TetR/AcrR family transcriptional regulator [Bosea sp. F3-2]